MLSQDQGLQYAYLRSEAALVAEQTWSGLVRWLGGNRLEQEREEISVLLFAGGNRGHAQARTERLPADLVSVEAKMVG